MSEVWTHDDPTIDPEFQDPPEKGDAPTSRLAIVSLVAGILGFVPLVGSLTAIVSGHVARGEIRDSKGRLSGDGFAKTGLILGYVWLVLTLLAPLLFFSSTRQVDHATVMPGPPKVRVEAIAKPSEIPPVPPVPSVNIERRTDKGHNRPHQTESDRNQSQSASVR